MSNSTQLSQARPARLVMGDLSIRVLSGGRLWLDGGAMFGIIPKPLWSRVARCDESNRIPLAATCLFLEMGAKRVLIETGVGPTSKYGDKDRGFFSFGEQWLLDSLAAIGVEPGSIDYVILTHLHFDHAGGGTIPDGKGGFRPTFPRAKYLVQKGEWDDAVRGHAVMSGTYRAENLAPLEQAGVLSWINGDAEILPGLRVAVLPGHTRHQQSVVIESGGQKLPQPADLMPTAAHVGLRYNMAYDLLPFENMENKKRLLAEAADQGWMLLLGQDPDHPAWRVQRRSEDRFELGRVELDPL